jgi:O-antigen/teichoic acid export membrane protein
MGVVSAGKWVVSGFIVNMVIRLANNLIMTRLVAPDAFGVVAVATITLLGLQMLSDVGLRQSIIRRETEVEDIYQDTVWVTQILKGFVVSLFVILIALFLYIFGDDVGGVYSSEILPVVLLVVSFSPIISGFELTKVAIQNRNLTLSLLTKIDIFSQLMGLIFGVSVALFEDGVWGLIIGPLVYNFFRVSISAVLLPGRFNRFRFDREIFGELIGFGKWVVVSSLVSFLSYYGDQLILARFISAEELGYVAIAVFFVGVARSLITKLTNDVFFARLSSVYRESPSLLKKSYYSCRLWTDFYLLVIAGGLFVTAEFIVELLYDDRYQQVSQVLGVLCLSLIFERYMMFSPLCWVKGQSRTPALIQSLKVAFLFIGLPYTLVNFDFIYAMYFIAFHKAIEIPFVLYIKNKDGLLIMSREIFTLLFFPLGILAGYSFLWLLGFIFP